MAASQKYSTFADFRKDIRGSTSWSNHIDEIADQAFQVDESKNRPVALFDSFEDFDSDDE